MRIASEVASPSGKLCLQCLNPQPGGLNSPNKGQADETIRVYPEGPLIDLFQLRQADQDLIACAQLVVGPNLIRLSGIRRSDLTSPLRDLGECKHAPCNQDATKHKNTAAGHLLINVTQMLADANWNYRRTFRHALNLAR